MVRYKKLADQRKKEAANSTDATATIGMTASGAFGVGGSVSWGITFDTKGNVGLAATGNIGGGFPSAGVGGFISFSNAPNIYKQSGLGVVVGASGGPGVVAVGAEYCMMIDQEEDTLYHGGTLSVSAGLYPTIAEVHGEVGYTSVVGFNVFDALIGVVDLLLMI